MGIKNTIEVCLQRETEPDFKSSFLMRVMGTNYSHALIRFIPDRTIVLNNITLIAKVPYIFECIGHGVSLAKESDVFPGHSYEHRWKLPLKVSRDYFYGYIEGSYGKEYSQSQLIGILLLQKLKLDKLRLPFWHNKRGKMICSELVARVLFDCCGIKLGHKMDFITPLHIEEALSKRFG